MSVLFNFLCLWLCLVSHVTGTESEPCTQTWFVRNESTGECHCGHSIDRVVSCDEESKEVKVLDCYCMTLDSELNETVVGACFSGCVNTTESYFDHVYKVVPQDISGTNNSMCDFFNRRGTLCRECRQGYGFQIYSFNGTCVQCDTTGKKKSKHIAYYIAVVYLPLNIFIAVIIVLKIGVVHPKLYACIFLIQCLTTPYHIEAFLKATRYNPVVQDMSKIGMTVYGVWNLDFFRSLDFVAGICSDITVLEVLALDYLVAAYPLLLTVIVYTLIELHHCGFRPVMYISRPFHFCLARFGSEWNIQTSIMDALVTFCILSSTKLFNTSFEMLAVTELFLANGSSHGHYFFYDASIKYFGAHHLPYALMALVIIFVFIILPMCLLLFYPLNCFQSCLRRCKLKGKALDHFVKTFNQYYKDGSEEGTMDCRWFAAVYPIMRFASFLTYTLTLNGFYFRLSVPLTLVFVILIIAVQPYKKEYAFFNIVDAVIMLFVALFYACVDGLNTSSLEEVRHVKPLFMLATVVGLFPLAYMSAVVLYWLYKRQVCCFRFVVFKNNTFTESLPHRLLHSDDTEYNSS